jgi:hypothetical protein
VPRFSEPAPGPTGPPTFPAEDPDCALDGWDDHCEEWTALYDNPNGSAGSGPDQVTAIAAGRKRTYVTGGSWDDTTQHYDILTAAYDQETGAEVWTSRYNGPDSVFDVGYAVAVDAQEELVFVAGTRDGPDVFGGDVAVVALEAATGKVVWEASYDGTASDHDQAFAVSVDDGTVYAAGGAHGLASGDDAFVLALEAASGKREWISTGFDTGFDRVYTLRAGGGRVVAAGLAESGGNADQLVMAFHAKDDPAVTGDQAGEVAWISRFDGGGYDDAFGMDMSADDSTVVVAGASEGTDGVYNYLTTAYDVSSGERSWVARYMPPESIAGTEQAVGTAVALSPDGTRAFVTGISSGTEPSLGYGFATVAYDVATGQQAWATPFHPAATSYGVGSSIAVSPNGRRVYTTGPSFAGYFVMEGAYETVAHDAATGDQLWAARYERVVDDVADLLPYPSFVVPARDGKQVFVTGTYVNYLAGDGTQSFSDYWTMAYEA